jgi:hypothetical protein
MANSISAARKKYTMAGLAPGAVLSILALQSLILLILFLGWVVGQWAWLRHSFPGGLFAGSFPIVVTWAGAAGGIAHAVRGLTTHWSRYVDPWTSDEERQKWNAWSLAQGPLGAVYGSAGILLLVVVLGVIGSGSSGNLDLSPAGRLTLAAIAFVIGYHQQIFHDMITRTVEAIFAPRSRSDREDIPFGRDKSRRDFAATAGTTTSVMPTGLDAPDGYQSAQAAGAEIPQEWEGAPVQAAAQEWQDTAYADAIAGNESHASQGVGHVELATDAGRQWSDSEYAELPAEPGTHAWQQEVPAANSAQTWTETAPAQSWSPESDGSYAGVWTDPLATQLDKTDPHSAAVGAAEAETAVIEEERTIPIEPGVAKGAEETAAPTDRTDGQAAPTEAADLAPESTRVQAQAANGEGAPASAIVSHAAEAVPPEIDGAAIDAAATGDAEIDAAEPSAAVPQQTTTARRTRTTGPSRARRQAR